jgi:hypothetical protein
MTNLAFYGADRAESALTAGIHDLYVPDPATEPGAIAAAQARIVGEYHGMGFHDPVELSEAVNLPVWVVRRRLADLGLGPPVERKQLVRAKTEAAKSAIVALLRSQGRPMTGVEIARALALPPRLVQDVVTTSPETFAPAGHGPRTHGRRMALWTVRKGQE